MSQPATPNSRYVVLKNPEFRAFLAMRMCLTLAVQIQSLVVGFQLYRITEDPLSLGLIGLTEAVPAIAVSLYAGHLADIMSRRKIILFCLGLFLISSASLWVVSWESVMSLFNYKLWPIYALIFLTGLARGFAGPAIFSFMAQLVEKKHFPAAVQWSSTNWQMGSVLGPALAGGLLYAFDVVESYFVQVLLCLLAFVFAMLTKSRPVPESTEGDSFTQRLVAGVKFVFNNQIILSAISLDLFAVLFGGAVALLPAFQKDILMVGEFELGVMRAAPAVGSLVMAVWLARFPIQKNAGIKMLLTVAGFGVSMIGFGLSKIFFLSVFMLFLSGAFDFVSVIIRGTLLQVYTPDHLKGRVSAVNKVFVGSSNEIGAFESGLAARLLGTAASVVFGGAMTLVVVGATALKAKSLHKLHLEEEE